MPRFQNSKLFRIECRNTMKTNNLLKKYPFQCDTNIVTNESEEVYNSFFNAKLKKYFPIELVYNKNEIECLYNYGNLLTGIVTKKINPRNNRDAHLLECIEKNKIPNDFVLRTFIYYYKACLKIYKICTDARYYINLYFIKSMPKSLYEIEFKIAFIRNNIKKEIITNKLDILKNFIINSIYKHELDADVRKSAFKLFKCECMEYINRGSLNSNEKILSDTYNNFFSRHHLGVDNTNPFKTIISSEMLDIDNAARILQKYNNGIEIDFAEFKILEKNASKLNIAGVKIAEIKSNVYAKEKEISQRRKTQVFQKQQGPRPCPCKGIVTNCQLCGDTGIIDDS